MRNYENIFIARQELSPTQVQTLADTYGKLIADEGGEVSKTEYCGLRQLAYPIKKSASGHYVLMNVKAKPATILELERKMRLNEDVVRFLTINVEELDPNPSALMNQTRQREGYYGERSGKPGHRSSRYSERDDSANDSDANESEGEN